MRWRLQAVLDEHRPEQNWGGPGYPRMNCSCRRSRCTSGSYEQHLQRMMLLALAEGEPVTRSFLGVIRG